MIWLMSFKQSGFTLLEVVIAVFIIGTVVAGMFGLFLLTLRSAQTGERRVAAVALANERMEMVRNLPYVEVGTQGGVPSGPIWPDEDVARNGEAAQRVLQRQCDRMRRLAAVAAIQLGAPLPQQHGRVAHSLFIR